VSDLENVAWQARALWMLFASVFKREWAIDDYPVRLRFQPVPEPSQASRLKPIPWTASVINWPAMSGQGNTKQEALAELRRRFEQYKAKEKKLPRPGIKVPIEFAVSRRVERYPELAKEFFHQILEVDWAWISDESSLWDFHGDETNDRFVEKIRRVYGIDVSDISSGNLADIFEQIAISTPMKGVNP
jgi:predicted RNase H-like HicB family nuclease